ncbi:MAG: membrane protein insertase YidC [Treponema sp.]|jgi:YidC/Oxa1 family membrane protein insertase|nr:membrane protein insertase YidC [Treponema sp.]
MEKRTLLAVVLSVVVISVYYVIQGIFFPPQQPVPQTAQSGPAGAETPGALPIPGGSAPATGVVDSPRPVTGMLDNALLEGGPQREEHIIIETDDIIVTLTNAGGDILSYKLKHHKDKEELVDMVFPDSNVHAFSLAFGNTSAEPVTAFFNVKRPSPYIVEFTRDFPLASGGENWFTVSKRYEFMPKEYMFQLDIDINGGQSVSSFNFDGAAYSLSSGPQIGPKFTKLDQRNDYRFYYSYTKGKWKQEKTSESAPTILNTMPSWASIAGKYFTLIGIPYASQYDVAFSARPERGIPSASRLYFIRPAVNTSRITDTYRFYLGPKNQEVLAKYNNGDNLYKLEGLQLIEVANSKGFLSPLETALKWLLMLFHRMVPNYGIAIILLTIFVKVLFFPLTKKSSEGTLRMQALQPRIKEIQEKYKDNPQKMNIEMAAFYKREGFNPLAGCLPMLLQIPIFLAMYNLFNNHFDLRGAMFIPVWIPDLSLPESIFNFSPTQLPILGWSDIRLLPFIYVGSQLLYGKVTQTPDQQGNSQMKLMMFAMPIVFFFILYDVPSGLLIYWIMSNMLTLVQQVIINRYLAPKRAAMSNSEPVLAKSNERLIPRKKKKR